MNLNFTFWNLLRSSRVPYFYFGLVWCVCVDVFNKFANFNLKSKKKLKEKAFLNEGERLFFELF